MEGRSLPKCLMTRDEKQTSYIRDTLVQVGERNSLPMRRGDRHYVENTLVKIGKNDYRINKIYIDKTLMKRWKLRTN